MLAARTVKGDRTSFFCIKDITSGFMSNFIFFLVTASHYVTYAGLELVILPSDLVSVGIIGVYHYALFRQMF
jgi:hypothetical protein